MYYNIHQMQNTHNHEGLIRMYIGPMFSGKTTALLEAFNRHSICGRKCLLVKHISDTRYDSCNVVSHDGVKCNTKNIVVCGLLSEINDMIKNYDVVCIDEIQFFNDAPIYCDLWANKGLIVEVAGLNGTYMREEFPVISKMIPLAEEIYKKTAICRETCSDAHFTFRMTNDTQTIVIGGSDIYKPVDRKTYFTEQK